MVWIIFPTGKRRINQFLKTGNGPENRTKLDINFKRFCMHWDRISMGQVPLTATFVLEFRSYTDTREVYVAVVCVCALVANCERHGSASCSTCLSAVPQFHLFSCSTVTVPSLQFCFLCHQVSRCISLSSLPFLITSEGHFHQLTALNLHSITQTSF